LALPFELPVDQSVDPTPSNTRVVEVVMELQAGGRLSGAARRRYCAAYDVLPSGQALGFQQMRVGEQDADSTLDNALSMAPVFSLDRNAAVREIRAVVRVDQVSRFHVARCIST
jgi:hypothetical protein